MKIKVHSVCKFNGPNEKHFLKTADFDLPKKSLLIFCLGAVYSYPLKLLWFFRIRVKAQGGVFLPCKKASSRLQFAPICCLFCLLL